MPIVKAFGLARFEAEGLHARGFDRRTVAELLDLPLQRRPLAGIQARNGKDLAAIEGLDHQVHLLAARRVNADQRQPVLIHGLDQAGIVRMVEHFHLLVRRIGIFRRSGPRSAGRTSRQTVKTRPNCNQGNDTQHGTLCLANRWEPLQKPADSIIHRRGKSRSRGLRRSDGTSHCPQGVNRRRKSQPMRNFDSVRRTAEPAAATVGMLGSRMPPQLSTNTGRQ